MSPDNELDRARNVVLESYLTGELARTARLGGEVSLVLMDLAEPRDSVPDCRLRLGRALARHCRAVDISLCDRRGAWVILPGTPACSALALVQRIRHEVERDFDLFAGIADTRSSDVFNAASLRASAERALSEARNHSGGDTTVIAPPLPTAPERAEPPTGLKNADLFELSSDWLERIFPCPESGSRVQCSFTRGPNGWDVRACSAANGKPTACSRQCLEAQRLGIPLAGAWSAVHAEPPET